MNNIDFTNYKFRSSFLPTLMVNGRSKSDILSETAKTGLRELWIKEVFGREKYDTTNKFTEKGIMCEADAMDLIKKVTRKTYFKNKEEFSNEFITGTPDIVLPDSVKDTKCSWSIHTFMNVDEDYALKNYYYQILGYMWLTGTPNGEIIFCLVNTPEEIMNDEMYRLSFKLPELNNSEEFTNKVKMNYIFDDIPEKMRLKRFSVPFSQEDVELLKERIIAGREYLKTLSL